MFNFKLFTTLTLLTLTFSHTHAFAKGTIVGGTNVAANEEIASTTVALYFESLAQEKEAEATAIGSPFKRAKTFGGSICTGSILDASTILTAAHCVAGAARGMVIFATDIKNHTPANSRAMKSVKVYAKLSNANVGAEQNDVATVTFLGGLPSGFKPAKFLPKSALMSALHAGGSIVLAGYGVTQYNPADKTVGAGTSGTLRKVTTSINKVGSSNLWVGAIGKTACHGDSGGPAFINYQGQLAVVGVTSRSTRKNGDCNGDAIYTQFSGLSAFSSQF